MWKKIRDAFIPWNLLHSEKSEGDGVRHVDYGQLLIDGTNGDIADMAPVIERAEHEPPSPAGREAGARFFESAGESGTEARQNIIASGENVMERTDED